MAKAIRLKGNNFLDSTSIVYKKQQLKNTLDQTPKIIYSYNGGGNTLTFTLPNTSSMYLVIAMINGNDNWCIFDVVYGRGQYTTRIKNTSNPDNMSINYDSNGVVNMYFRYSVMVKIIELPVF